MCYAVFIGTNQKQPPEPAFVVGKTLLYLTEESETEHEKQFEKVGLLEKFSKKFVYHVGSWQGCSCGFPFLSRAAEADQSENTKNMESGQKLLDLWRELIKKEAVIEFFCCWEGDWQSSIIEKKELKLSEIGQIGADFLLEERVFIFYKTGN